MAQFDVVSYSSQVFWFTLFFFFGYFVTVRFVLPAIYSGLRTREWRLQSLDKEIKHNENVLLFWAFLFTNRFYAGAVAVSFDFTRSVLYRRELFVEFAKFTMLEPYLRASKEGDAQLYLSKLSELFCRQRILATTVLK